jgi:hypothetical protein
MFEMARLLLPNSQSYLQSGRPLLAFVGHGVGAGKLVAVGCGVTVGGTAVGAGGVVGAAVGVGTGIDVGAGDAGLGAAGDDVPAGAHELSVSSAHAASEMV